jgi:hypothetical protein
MRLEPVPDRPTIVVPARNPGLRAILGLHPGLLLIVAGALCFPAALFAWGKDLPPATGEAAAWLWRPRNAVPHSHAATRQLTPSQTWIVP